MNCFLFGAGASHSYEGSAQKVPPPLAKNFFSTYNALTISCDRFVRVGNIINYVRDTRGFDPIEFASWEENIEDFLSEIDDHLVSPERVALLDIGTKSHWDQAFTQMLFLFSAVLNEIQNGPVCKNYSRLCQTLGDDDALITFNWDTLLDRALSDLGDWSPDDGYGVEFLQIFRDGWIKPNRPEKPSRQLIKLHGSTNWIMPYFSLDLQENRRVFANRNINPDERPLYCFQYARQNYKTFGNRSRTGYAPFSYFYYPPDVPVPEGNDAPPGYVRISFVATPDVPEFGQSRIGSAATASMPLLIPPVRKKAYNLMGKTFDHLWGTAIEKIKNSDSLTIIGYSFPQTDIRAWEMLETAVEQRETPLVVRVVDPYPEQLSDRLLAKFGNRIDLTILKQTFTEFTQDFA